MTDDDITRAIRRRLNEHRAAIPVPDRDVGAGSRVGRQDTLVRSSVVTGAALSTLVVAAVLIAVAAVFGRRASEGQVAASLSPSAPAASPSTAHLVVVIPTMPPPQVPHGCPQAARGGLVLRGDPDATPAVWLESQDHDILRVVWPHGFTARFDPTLELLDERGMVVASEGQTLATVGGQMQPDFDWYACEILKVE